jgi:trigger factor
MTVKVEIKEIKPCQTLFKIEVPSEIVKEEYEEVYDEIRKVASVPGFRVGKVPKNLVISRFADDAKEQVIKRLLPEYYEEAVKGANITPVTPPEFSEIKIGDTGNMSFCAKVEVRPRVEIKSYKGLRIEKKKVDVGKEDIDSALADMREANAQYTQVERPAEAGDYVLCDFVCKAGENVIDKSEDYWFPIHENSFIPGFTKHLIGTKTGDFKQITLTLPQNFQKKEYAGKEAVFDVSVKQVREKGLPSIDDEFAKSLGNYNSVTELEMAVKDRIFEKRQQEVRIEMEGQLFEQLLKNSTLEVPPTIVEEHFQKLKDKNTERLVRMGFKKGDIEAREKEFEDKLHLAATRDVKLFFVLDEIIRRENVTVTDEELDKRIEGIAKHYNVKFDTLKNRFAGEGLLGDQRLVIAEEKATQFLLDNAQIVEVEAEKR